MRSMYLIDHKFESKIYASKLLICSRYTAGGFRTLATLDIKCYSMVIFGFGFTFNLLSNRSFYVTFILLSSFYKKLKIVSEL